MLGLVESLFSADDERLRAATFALAGYRHTIPFQHEVARRRAAMIDIVHEIPELGVFVLSGMAVSQSVGVRYDAAESADLFFELDREHVESVLQCLLNDDEVEVRFAAAASLRYLGLEDQRPPTNLAG